MTCGLGRFDGELTATWHPDGRCMRLANSFAFIDGNELRWDVPPGAQIDGASIPQFLWSVTGSPYTGKYRNASVVHDFYCSIRSRSAQATHRMFREAMLVSGVSERRANLMYAAVKYAGPRWSTMDIHNVTVALGGNYGAQPEMDGGPTGTMKNFSEPGSDWGWVTGQAGDSGDVWTPSNVSAEEFSGYAAQILDGSMGISGIEAALDEAGEGTAGVRYGEFSIETGEISFEIDGRPIRIISDD